MKIKCKREILLNNINIVLKSVASKTTIPILECILLVADKEGFKLISNDLELGIETANIEAEIIEKGKLAIDARTFSDIIRNLSDEEVSIESDEKNLTIIKSGKTEFKILGQNGEEFPIINLIEKEDKYTIKASVLKNMIKQTKFSVSTDESKPTLTGELLEIKEDYLNIVSIDGFRVSFVRNKSDISYKEKEVIIPYKTLNEITKIIPDNEDNFVNLYFSDKNIMFELENCTIVSRILEGEFLKYEQIFIEEFNTKAEINKTELLSSLERSLIVSKENKKTPVKLELKKPNTLVITSNTDFCNFYEEIRADFEGEEIEIAFNPKYLIEALRVIEDENILAQFMTSLSPCIIKSIKHDDYKYLILPLKLNN